MKVNSTLGRLLIGGTALLLLAGAGYMIVDGISSLNDLDQTLSTLTADLTAMSEVEPEVDETEELAAAAPPSDVTSSSGTDVGGSGNSDESINLLLPTDNDTLVISSERPAITVGLESREITPTVEFKNIQVQLLVMARLEDNAREALSPGPASVSEPDAIENLTAGEAESIILRFNEQDLPPSGTYEAWLLVTADNGKPISKKLTLEVSSYPAGSIQHRLADAQGDAKTIHITGIRWWPGNWANVPQWLVNWWANAPQWLVNWANDPHWDEYKLRMWDETLREGVTYYAVPSELADNTTGRSGLLTASPPAQPTTGDQTPLTIRIKPEAVEHAGTYKGILSIYTSDGSQKETINVTAYLRHALIWPFLWIFFGALFSGWLLRYGIRDIKQNASFQKLLIARARNWLRQVPACVVQNRRCSQIDGKLQLAEHALAMGDVANAKTYLEEANNEIRELEQALYLLAEARQLIEARRKALEGRYSRKDVDDKISVAEGHHGLAQQAYDRGDLSAMKEQLAKIPKALDDAEAGLKPKPAEAPPERRARIIVVGETDFSRSTLYTDKDVTFAVEDHETTKFAWRIWWERPWLLPDKALGGKTDLAQYSYPTTAEAEKDYPRQIRVEAESQEGIEASRKFEVCHPYEIQLPDEVNAGEPVKLKLVPVGGRGVPDPVEWRVYEAKQGKPASDPYTFPAVGKYRLAAFVNKRCIAAADVRVLENPVDAAAREFKRNAKISTVAWAFVAAVAGILYIGTRVRTFGSAMDYFWALGWALGLSTTSVPAQSAMDKIMKELGLGPLAAPAAETEETEKVPELEGKTYAEAKQIAQSKGLTLTPDPSSAGDDWKVISQTPKAKDPIPENCTITVKLEKPAEDTVPPLEGMTYAEANQIAISKGLTLSKDPPNAGDDWKVTSQTPKAEEPVPGDGIITVNLEKKEEGVKKVPLLIDLPRDEAKTKAENEGYTVVVATDPPGGDHTSEWLVDRQDPVEESDAPKDPKDRKITIFLKSPRVVGDE